MSIIDTLVTDRTQADVQRAAELAAKGYGGMTADEVAEWMRGLKGAYNAQDLNRVGSAMTYIADRLNAEGIDIRIQPKTDWMMTDIPKESHLMEYQALIATIREAIAYPAGTAHTPDVLELTYSGANDIEEILVAAEDMITKMILAYRHCGMPVCGQGGFIV